MRLKPISTAILCSLALIVGCSRSDDTAKSSSPPATQPAAAATPATQPIADAEPTASMLMIDRATVWFPPAMLRLDKASDGKVIARLYSDDPKGVLTGKDIVNSYDMRMVLTNISDPADISKAVWTNPSSSMDKQDTPYGIFLNNQQDVLQPQKVTVRLDGQGEHVRVLIQGTFNRFHISDQTPNPAPTPVTVQGLLDATLPRK
jgi:hypothetical protein